VTLIVNQLYVSWCKLLYVSDVRIELDGGQRIGPAAQLNLYLIHVIVIDVTVAYYMYELAHAQTADLSNHVGKQAVAGNIKRHAQEHVGAALIHLAAESTFTHIELTEYVTGWQAHLIQYGRIPGSENVSATMGISANTINQLHQLIYFATVGFPVSPLHSVYDSGVSGSGGTSLPVWCLSIGVPDGIATPHTVSEFTEPVNVAGTFYKPQQFTHHSSPGQALGGQGRKTLTEIVLHTDTKQTAATHASAVGCVASGFYDVFESIQVLLFHYRLLQ
jgi:hypothetical protein